MHLTNGAHKLFPPAKVGCDKRCATCHLQTCDPDITEPWKSLDQASLQRSAAFVIAYTYTFSLNSLEHWEHSELHLNILDRARVALQILVLLAV